MSRMKKAFAEWQLNDKGDDVIFPSMVFKAGWNAAEKVWIDVSDDLPQQGIPVIGFSEDWVCDDFNLDGQRECWINGDGYWVSPKWFDEQDTYWTDEVSSPTHWRKRPASPIAQIPTTNNNRD